MIESQEVELKLELDPADIDRFRALPLLGGKSKRPLLQVSTYYDTPAGDLRKAGFSLRLRRKGRRCVQTLKRKGESGGFSARAEWEQRIAGPDLDFAALEGTPAGKLLSKKKIRGQLTAVSETRVKRTVWQIRRGRSAIELILDEGEVAAGARGQPICEIELELKAGKRATLFELARDIAAEVPLRMGAMSKSERGFALVDGNAPRVRKAEPVLLDAQMNVADAFAAIVQSCLRHFRLNEVLLADGRKPGALHQMRVAMRRLRSAIGLFKPAFAGAEQQRIAGELRWFAAELGRARDLDVILANRRSAAAAGGAEGAAAAAETRRLKGARKAAYGEVAAALASPRVPAMILDLVRWAETGEWRGGELARRPVLGFSDERLGQRWRRVRKGGKDLAGLDPEARHRLRIETKKLRYAAEFFAALAEKGKRRQQQAFLTALEALQENLGTLNDIETARLIAPDQPPPEDPEAVLARAQAAHDRLRETGPYWR